MSIGPAAASEEAVDVEALRQGLWAVAFVVLPEIPECEQAIEWLGEIQHSFPKVQFLALSPWLTDELRETAARAELPLAVDEDAQLGMILGIGDVPAILSLREGRVTNRLVWPFEREELRASVAELSATQDDGPAGHVGTEVTLGKAETLTGDEVELDESPGPLLFSFFNPLCSPCWQGLAALVELNEDIEVVLAVLVPEAMTEGQRQELRETGLTVVLDEERTLMEALSIRSTPTYVLRDGTAVIRWVREAPVQLEELREAVLDLQGDDATEGDAP
ncbi:MAG: hypothetical protein R6U88_03150 [Candidatus Bipolaricaulota bacterium]